jgi:predicted nucleotidyltransferase
MTDLDPSRFPLLAELSKACRGRWPSIAKAARGAATERATLAHRISAAKTKRTPPDTSIVVFGSLARGEWTQGSDRDWTLLVDGQVDVHHAEVVSGIATFSRKAARSPARRGYSAD